MQSRYMYWYQHIDTKLFVFKEHNVEKADSGNLILLDSHWSLVL